MSGARAPSEEREAVVGILGGMGPEATVRLFELLTRATPAQRDQEHLRVLVLSNPKIPDRTAAILGQGEDPLPALLEGASLLERAGADFLIVPCNTAHHWLPSLRERLRVPILDMIDETARAIAAHVPAVRRVGLVATTGTLRTGLYPSRLAGRGIAVVLPTDAEQAQVMSVIYGVKAGNGALAAVGRALRGRGAEALLLGCTELSLVGLRSSSDFPIFDPLEILARRAVDVARNWDGHGARLDPAAT